MHSLPDRRGPFDGFAINIFQHEVVWSNVVNLADIWVIEGCNGAGLMFEAGTISSSEAFDGDDPAQARVAGCPN